jgi:endonuclease V-like protein UPF0215 family
MHPVVIPNEAYLGSGLVSKSRLLPLAKLRITTEIASISGQEYAAHLMILIERSHVTQDNFKFVLYTSIGIEIFNVVNIREINWYINRPEVTL